MRGGSSAPPAGLPVYRVLTGPDDAAFCHRVSEALEIGYVLHGPAAVTFDGTRVIVAQAVVWSPAPSAAKTRIPSARRGPRVRPKKR